MSDHRESADNSSGFFLVLLAAIVLFLCVGGFLSFMLVRGRQVEALARAEMEMQVAEQARDQAEQLRAVAKQAENAQRAQARAEEELAVRREAAHAVAARAWPLEQMTPAQREFAQEALDTVKEKGLDNCPLVLVEAARRLDPAFIAAEEARAGRAVP
jgi:hypothetical protein